MFTPVKNQLLPIVVGVEIRALMAMVDPSRGLRLWLCGFTADRSNFFHLADVSRRVATELGEDEFVANRDHPEAAMVVDGLIEAGAFKVVGDGSTLKLDRAVTNKLAEEAGASVEEAGDDSLAGVGVEDAE
jgi:hypothetical protein